MQTALHGTAVSNILDGERVILASASARRKEILEDCLGWTGFEIIPSSFEETLDHAEYEGKEIEYPVDTSMHKAIEVYEREVQARPDNAPDLVISADTIVLLPSASPAFPARILEKPGSRAANLKMLEDQNGKTVKCITGITVIFPSLQHPGYVVRSMAETTFVTFDDCSDRLLASYADNGEGVDRAGGWAIQGRGSLLIKGIEGDFNNVKGFPAHAFYAFIQKLIDDDEFPADE